MSFALDPHGYLIEPQLHDGYIIGLDLGEEGVLRIRLRDLSGMRFVMRLVGLSRLISDEFREANIIFDIAIFRGEPPPAELVGALLGELHPSVGSPYREQHQLAIEECTRRIAENETTLVNISPSYGCGLLALCQEVFVDQE
jgi:hypothetical protein